MGYLFRDRWLRTQMTLDAVVVSLEWAHTDLLTLSEKDLDTMSKEDISETLLFVDKIIQDCTTKLKNI